MEKLKENKETSGLQMYFNPEVAQNFAQHEQNEKNFRVANIVDAVLMQEVGDLSPIFAAELGGGAHPDRYDKFFEKLLSEPKGHIDWVDISPFMLDLAKQYISDPEHYNRLEVIEFVQKEILQYLNDLPDQKLDVAIMKYTFEYLKDIEKLLELLQKKLKSSAKMVATIGRMEPELKGSSTNAAYFVNGKQVTASQSVKLSDGDKITIKFFNVSGDPNSGFIKDAETDVFYHSPEKIKQLAQKFGFEIFLGNWKDYVKDKSFDEKMDQNILVLKKK